MPIFEYSCLGCGKNFSALVGVVAQNAAPSCPACGKSGENLRKKVSRFARVRSEDDRLENLADEADRMDANDPRAVRQLLDGMAGNMDGEMDANDLEQIMDEATGDTVGGNALPLPMED